MDEKTIARIAQEAFWNATGPTSADDWECAVSAAIAAHEARRWKPIETMDEVTVDNVIAGKRTGSRWVTAEFCRKYLAINAGYTHWAPIPAPPKEGE